MKKILMTVAVIGALAVAGYFYVFHKPHRDIASEEATITITAAELKEQFVSNAQLAEETYLDKVVAVKGVVLQKDESSIGLDGSVNASFNEADFSALQEGDEVTIKGRVLGFDDLFGEVKLDNCKIP